MGRAGRARAEQEFSEQSVIKDPPFSRLDMVSCRNMLIYMGRELQKLAAGFSNAQTPEQMHPALLTLKDYLKDVQ